jgi:branched-chain amino acid transport system substrate-binding protein
VHLTSGAWRPEEARVMRMLSLILAVVSFCLAGPAAAGETIKVGALLAVSGPASFLGTPEARTLEMLVEKANAAGGINGIKIELLIKDTGGSPEKAVSMAKQLIEENQVFAILGPSTSGESMQVKQLAEESGTLLISCAAAEVIVQPVAKWVFKTPQSDSHAVIRIFERIKKLGLTRIGVLTSNTGFGKAGKAQLEKLAPAYGLTVAASEVYDKTATDLTAEVTKMKAAGAEALVNWSIEPAQSIVLKNARQIGLTIPLFQSHGFGNVGYVKAAGAAAEGVVFPAGRLLVAGTLPDSNPQKKLLVDYKRTYEARFSEEVSTFGGHAYDAFLLLQAGLKGGGANKEKARDAIEAVKGLAGTAGIFNMSATDHCGLTTDAFEMLVVKDGGFQVLK